MGPNSGRTVMPREQPRPVVRLWGSPEDEGRPASGDTAFYHLRKAELLASPARPEGLPGRLAHNSIPVVPSARNLGGVGAGLQAALTLTPWLGRPPLCLVSCLWSQDGPFLQGCWEIDVWTAWRAHATSDRLERGTLDPRPSPWPAQPPSNSRWRGMGKGWRKVGPGLPTVPLQPWGSKYLWRALCPVLRLEGRPLSQRRRALWV